MGWGAVSLWLESRGGARRAFAALTILAVATLFSGSAAAAGSDDGAIHLAVVGGLGGVTQYTKLEKPFWESEIERRTQGRVVATIRPLDGGGLRGQEMLQLMRLGVVSFGTSSLSVAAGDDPEFNALDLPVLNPDITTLRKTVSAFRGRLTEILRERYDIHLLGVYAYPAQVVFCSSGFAGLGDLAGRRVRTSSVGQSELMTGLGAIPVLLPFAEVVPALRDGVVDCAVTGTLSGYEIGLYEYTTHVHALALSWGLSVFGANVTAWNALPTKDQKLIEEGVADLERRIWAQAETDTGRGLACNAGTTDCGIRPERPMTVVATSRSDAERRRRILTDVVIPHWIDRCGEICAQDWNTYLAPVHGIKVGAE